LSGDIVELRSDVVGQLVDRQGIVVDTERPEDVTVAAEQPRGLDFDEEVGKALVGPRDEVELVLSELRAVVPTRLTELDFLVETETSLAAVGRNSPGVGGELSSSPSVSIASNVAAMASVGAICR
jgi:hypothetical protein